MRCNSFDICGREAGAKKIWWFRNALGGAMKLAWFVKEIGFYSWVMLLLFIDVVMDMVDGGAIVSCVVPCGGSAIKEKVMTAKVPEIEDGR
ncbi:hypothetical protein LR48_Vigan04g040500 [Vigna angularis]|uniref:Uncharacterized protein n=1 Tax=Phaseolus angularis TaxID=3914 RepID=A0A0L9UCC8_PHAAN|nr:hypothetical protein LR48_Vigan04g040500 [Vigna angularis]